MIDCQISPVSIYHTSEQYFSRALIGQLGGDQPSPIHLRAAQDKQNGFCLYIVRNKFTLWSASYSACVVYTKKIIYLSVGSLRGRPQKGRKVKMSAGGRRNGLQGRYCFLCFFRPSDERKNPDWSDLMNYLIHPSDWSATCHSKPQRSSHIYIRHGR